MVVPVIVQLVSVTYGVDANVETAVGVVVSVVVMVGIEISLVTSAVVSVDLVLVVSWSWLLSVVSIDVEMPLSVPVVDSNVVWVVKLVPSALLSGIGVGDRVSTVPSVVSTVAGAVGVKVKPGVIVNVVVCVVWLPVVSPSVGVSVFAVLPAFSVLPILSVFVGMDVKVTD
jgi:hypothetical protein